jgi:hypothetical protein
MLQITALAIFLTGFISEIKNMRSQDIIDHPFFTIFSGSCGGIVYIFCSVLACILIPDYLDIAVPVVLLMVFYCDKYVRRPFRNYFVEMLEFIPISLLVAVLGYTLAMQITSLFN